MNVMETTSLIIYFITLSLVVTWFSITITMTNVFGNNKPIVTSYDKPPIFDTNPKSKCFGPEDTKYKLYDTIKTDGKIIKECEGVISASKNTKMVLQSDGRVVIYDKNKGIVKSSNYLPNFSNPFLLVNTGSVVDSKNFGGQTFLKDVFEKAEGNRVNINDDYTFTNVYNTPPMIDFKGKGINTPSAGYVSLLRIDKRIRINYEITNTNDAVMQILTLLDPLEVMKYCVTSILNILDLSLFKSATFTLKLRDENENTIIEINNIKINIPTNYLKKQLKEDINIAKTTIIKIIISEMTKSILIDVFKVTKDFIALCQEYVIFRTGFHNELRVEEKGDPQKLNTSDNGYFLWNTETKYTNFISRMIYNFAGSQDDNAISKFVTKFTLDELWTNYQNQMELNPTAKPLHVIYIRDTIFDDLYNTPPSVDFKGKGTLTPIEKSVSILNKNTTIDISYVIMDKNNILNNLLVILDPLEVLKYMVTSTLNLLEIKIEIYGIKLRFKNFPEDTKTLFLVAIGKNDDTLFINTNYLNEIYKQEGNDINRLKIYMINGLVENFVQATLERLKVPNTFINKCKKYVTLRSGFHRDYRLEEKISMQDDNGYFLLNTELKYHDFVSKMITSFALNQDENTNSKEITQYTMDELWVSYQNSSLVTRLDIYIYIPDPEKM